jgi:YegS/Rv2252/BmrU family lipid kinase
MTSHRHGTALVVNTHSRKAERFFFDVLDALAKSDLEVTSIFPVRDPRKLAEAVKTAIDAGNKMVIVGGGDGTISALVGHFVNTDVVLGILPLGTANSFIKSLGIPDNPEEAIEVITKGRVEKIDVGKINDTYYANVISFGFTTLIASKLSDRMKKHFGLLAYFFEGIRQTLKLKPFDMKVTCDGQSQMIKTYQVIVANGSFYGPTSLAREATVNSGKLMLLTMSGMRRRTLLKAWVGSLFGKSLASYGAHHVSASKIEIETDPIQDVSIDGEVNYVTPLKLEVVPEGIHIMVPPRFRKRKQTRSV